MVTDKQTDTYTHTHRTTTVTLAHAPRVNNIFWVLNGIAIVGTFNVCYLMNVSTVQLSSGKGKEAGALKCLIQLYYKSQRLSIYSDRQVPLIP